jgi:hypothetical protein
MQKRSVAAFALADLAQTAPPLGLGAEVDLAAVLDRQNVSTGNRRPGLLRPARNQPLRRHLRVRQKAPESLGLRTIAVAQLPDTAAAAHDRTFEQQRPLLSRRRSPNSPNDHSTSIIAAPQHHQKVPTIESQTTAFWEALFSYPIQRVTPKMCPLPSSGAGEVAPLYGDGGVKIAKASFLSP